MNKFILITLAILHCLLISACSTTHPLISKQVGQGNISVVIPSSLEIQKIDGEKFSSPSVYKGNYQLQLVEGKHTLQLRYKENWNAPDEAGHIITWQPVLLSHYFESNQTYKIGFDTPENRNEAEQFSAKPNIWLQTQNTLVYAEVLSVSSSSWLQAVFNPTTNTPEVDSDQLNVSRVAKSVGEPSPSQGQNESINDHVSSSTLKALKNSWLNASEQERAEFWEWIRRN